VNAKLEATLFERELEQDKGVVALEYAAAKKNREQAQDLTRLRGYPSRVLRDKYEGVLSAAQIDKRKGLANHIAAAHAAVEKGFRRWMEEDQKLVYWDGSRSVYPDGEKGHAFYNKAFRTLYDELFANADRMAAALADATHAQSGGTTVPRAPRPEAASRNMP
jgi:hypothetical protein